MNGEQLELKNNIEKAINLFIENDKKLLELKVYEPAVSHRIAFYLERDSFKKGFHVDCEYDKFFNLAKPGPDGKPMRPDILVHTRNQDVNNKIAIEIKKARTSKRDIKKLEFLTIKNGLYKYDIGVFIRFPNGRPIYRWIIDGQEEI